MFNPNFYKGLVELWKTLSCGRFGILGELYNRCAISSSLRRLVSHQSHQFDSFFQLGTISELRTKPQWKAVTKETTFAMRIIWRSQVGVMLGASVKKKNNPNMSPFPLRNRCISQFIVYIYIYLYGLLRQENEWIIELLFLCNTWHRSEGSEDRWHNDRMTGHIPDEDKAVAGQNCKFFMHWNLFCFWMISSHIWLVILWLININQPPTERTPSQK